MSYYGLTRFRFQTASPAFQSPYCLLESAYRQATSPPEALMSILLEGGSGGIPTRCHRFLLGDTGAVGRPPTFGNSTAVGRRGQRSALRLVSFPQRRCPLLSREKKPSSAGLFLPCPSSAKHPREGHKSGQYIRTSFLTKQQTKALRSPAVYEVLRPDCKGWDFPLFGWMSSKRPRSASLSRRATLGWIGGFEAAEIF